MNAFQWKGETMLGPYRTDDIQTTLDTLYGHYGVLYRVAEQVEAPKNMWDIWVVPDTQEREPVNDTSGDKTGAR